MYLHGVVVNKEAVAALLIVFTQVPSRLQLLPDFISAEEESDGFCSSSKFDFLIGTSRLLRMRDSVVTCERGVSKHRKIVVMNTIPDMLPVVARDVSPVVARDISPVAARDTMLLRPYSSCSLYSRPLLPRS